MYQDSIFASQKSKITSDEKSIFIFEKGLDFHLFLWYCCVLTGGTENEKYDKSVMAWKYITARRQQKQFPEMKELMEYMARYHEDLLKTMTDEQKEVFKKFEDCWGEYATYAEEAIFEYAFKLGTSLALEVLIE